MLIPSFNKIAIFAKRETTFTQVDEKSGKSNTQEYKYITGIDCTSGAVFTDLAISKDSLVHFDNIKENTIYNCLYTQVVVKGEKNATRTSSVSLQEEVGSIEVKLTKKG